MASRRQWIEVGDYRYDVYDDRGQQVPPIGSGHYGRVFVGYHAKTLEKVAIKRMDVPLGEKHTHRLLDRELKVSRVLHHPNIVRHYYQTDEIHGSLRVVHLVMEFVEGGSLTKYLEQHPKGVAENVARRFLCQMASAMSQMANMKWIHRDLKPDNMLMTKCADDGVIKIADFGFAREATQDVYTSFVGSPLWSAPELNQNRYYFANSDIWSVGIIYHQLLVGGHMFGKAQVKEDIYRIWRTQGIQLPSTVSKEGREVLTAMLNEDPTKRLTWEQFCSLKYVQSSPSIPLEVSQTSGELNWLQRVLSYENGATYPFPATASIPVSSFKKSISATLYGNNMAPSEILLIAHMPSGMVQMADDKLLGQYVSNTDETFASSVMYCFLQNSVQGKLEANQSTVTPTPQAPQGSLQLLVTPPPFTPDSTSVASNWFDILKNWNMLLEQYENWGDSLYVYMCQIKQWTNGIGLGSQRKPAFNALNALLRTQCDETITNFGPISRQLKDLAPIVATVRENLIPTLNEMNSVSLKDLTEAFPNGQLDPNATLGSLVVTDRMINNFKAMEQQHKMLLEAEIGFGASSDKASATYYKLPGADYAGPAFNPGISPLMPTKGYMPVLQIAMKELNGALGSVDFNLYTLLNDKVKRWEQHHTQMVAVYQKYLESLGKTCDAVRRQIQNAKLSPRLEDLQNAQLLVQLLINEVDSLITSCSINDQLIRDIIDARYKVDVACLAACRAAEMPMALFRAMNAKLPVEFKMALESVNSVSTSIAHLLGIPSTYYATLVEIERRRIWSDRMKQYCNSIFTNLQKVITEEETYRSSWATQHQALGLKQISRIIPIPLFNHEQADHPGAVSFSWNVYDPVFPSISKPPTSTLKYPVESDLNATFPQLPQSITDFQASIANTQALDKKCQELQLQNEHLVRQRATFLQMGAPQAIKQQLQEADKLKEENAKLEQRVTYLETVLQQQQQQYPPKRQ